jgi:hypothetical protein
MSLILQGSTSGSVTLQEPAVAGTTVLDLPATSGNVVVDSATQTLTNKTIQGGTITSGTAVASTSGTSIDFTSIPSWVKRITVMLSGVSTNGTSSMIIRIGDSGGVSATGYTAGYAESINGSGTQSANPTTGFQLQSTTVTSSTLTEASIVITNVSGNLWLASGISTFSNYPSATATGGSKSLSATLDRIRITTVNGTDTFDAGTINILYE